MSYPRIRVRGGPEERGRAYGGQARARVAATLAAYARLFDHYAGLDWAEARRRAAAFEAPIAEVGEDYLREMRGIADGAGVDYADVLAVNVRTELMFSGMAAAMTGRRAAGAAPGIAGATPTTTPTAGTAPRAASGTPSSAPGSSLEGRPQIPAAECTAAAVLPEASAGGHVLLGQNWDWKPSSADSLVVLEVERDDGPAYVTAVEAGLLAKTGMNAAGVGVTTNALVSEFDRGEPGLPYHVALRACLDAERASDALLLLEAHTRSSSANYLIAHADGAAVDAEGAPGGRDRLFLDFGTGGVLVHANHFTDARLAGRDLNRELSAGTLFRAARLRAGLAGGGATPERFQAALRDHAEYPLGVCAHPDPRRPEPERSATLVSVVMDLTARRMWIADGNPCTAPYTEGDYAGLLGAA
ncbi:C45 family autoproteolytic acyltransferase/hydolase [Nocardiopsis trehalosi]|uniref:C45 family autoproteolytic acyltransferase/hydolase n=1 Tax=Nocardiopsis trehalosi TaxID=109329 RepID=UPI000829D4AE|nr:C45 family peptidase [Nocardiopsis trehalosi]